MMVIEPAPSSLQPWSVQSEASGGTNEAASIVIAPGLFASFWSDAHWLPLRLAGVPLLTAVPAGLVWPGGAVVGLESELPPHPLSRKARAPAQNTIGPSLRAANVTGIRDER